MNNRYDEIMDNIKVTDEMRGRILQNVQCAVAEPNKQAKVISFSSIKRYVAIAACFAVLLVGALTVRNLHKQGQPSDPGGLTQDADIVTAASAEQLTEVIGFEVNGVSDVPFAVEETNYTAYWQELAEIKYSGDGQTITYRKSLGSDDNSGDYNSYDTVVDKELKGVAFELKGDGELFYLAVWSTNGYSYSLSFGSGVDEASLTNLLESNIAP